MNYVEILNRFILNGKTGDKLDVEILERTTAAPGTKSSYFGEDTWDDSDPICIFRVGDKMFEYRTSFDSWDWHIDSPLPLEVREIPNGNE